MPLHLLSYYKHVVYIKSGKILGKRETWMQTSKNNQVLGNHTMKPSNSHLTSRFWTQLHERCSHCHLQHPVTARITLDIIVKGQIWALLKFWITSTYNPGDLNKIYLHIICKYLPKHYDLFWKFLPQKQLQAIFPPTWLARGHTIPKSQQPKATMRIILSAGFLEISVFSTCTA